MVVEGKGQPLLGRTTVPELGVLLIGSTINSESSDIVEEFNTSLRVPASKNQTNS